MQPSFFRTIQRYFQNASQWFWKTPERALDQAYDAVLMIKVLENEYFGGEKIPTSSTNSTKYGDNTLACIQADLRKYLRLAEIRLSEFKVSRLIVDSTSWEISKPAGESAADSRLQERDRIAMFLDELNTNGSPPISASQNRERMTVILEKLKFIDEVLERYKPRKMSSTALVPLPPAQGEMPTKSDLAQGDCQTKQHSLSESTSDKDEGVLDKTGVLPRSILGTVNRIKRELDPKSEMQMIESFRNTKAKTLISIRFLLLLIIIPLLTQQLSKAIVVGPIVDRIYTPSQPFINSELQEEALEELRIFEERLRFDLLLGKFPETTSEATETIVDEKKAEQEIRQRVKEKVGEIAEEYTKHSTNAIKNMFADLLSLGAFALVILTNQQEIAVLKSFIDEMIYGLSDSAKAFIIILFTDIFVGFHSPHGWEILLEGVSRHLGLPASRDFIFLFIATFPVILDTIFKYWIFRYLNRVSPSAVATYRSMNE
jgi:hypothetical protein